MRELPRNHGDREQRHRRPSRSKSKNNAAGESEIKQSLTGELGCGERDVGKSVVDRSDVDGGDILQVCLGEQ